MEKKKKRILPKVLCTLLILIAILAVVIAFFASKNMKRMNSTIDDGMAVIQESYSITPVDTGEFSEIKMYGLMKFHVKQYDVNELGNLSVMTVNMGFMQMCSFVITPYEKDAPLLSMDFMYIMGNRKTYVEYYDLTTDKSAPAYADILGKLRSMTEKYADLEELETEPAWYDDLMTVSMHKKVSNKKDDEVNDMFCNAIRTYLQAAKDMEKLSDEEKAAKLEITQKYCDDLIEKGGVSTDVFKKELGKDTTKDFFDRVFFGTERARQ